MLEDMCNRLRRKRHALHDLNINYKLKSAVFNFIVVWKVVKIKTLANGWKKCSVTWKWICNFKNLKSATSTDYKKNCEDKHVKMMSSNTRGEQRWPRISSDDRMRVSFRGHCSKEQEQHGWRRTTPIPKIKLSVLRSIWMM